MSRTPEHDQATLARERAIAFNDGVEACIAAVVEEFGVEWGFTGRMCGLLNSVKVEIEPVVNSPFASHEGSRTAKVRPNPPVISPPEPVAEAYPPQDMTWSAAEQLR